MSYGSAPVPLRAKAVNAKKLLSEVDPDQPDPPPRLEWQRGQKAESAAAELPKECEWGCKKDSQGKTKFWKGGKVHVGTTRGGVPVACVYTSASLHDSQAAIPLMRQASERLEYRFDLMASAFCRGHLAKSRRSRGRNQVRLRFGSVAQNSECLFFKLETWFFICSSLSVPCRAAIMDTISPTCPDLMSGCLNERM